MKSCTYARNGAGRLLPYTNTDFVVLEQVVLEGGEKSIGVRITPIAAAPVSGSQKCPSGLPLGLHATLIKFGAREHIL